MLKKLKYKDKDHKTSDVLYDAICRLYKAIYGRPKDDFKFGLLSLFPENCCEYSSLFLAKFITKQIDGIVIEVVTGEDRIDKEIRHVWLKSNGINIDITANQFDPLLSSVLFYQGIGWHKRFRIIEKHKFNPDFHLEYHDDTKLDVLDDYFYLERKALASTT